MATCKECLHYVVCKPVADTGKFALDTERPDQSERCPMFADKSRFVELPCKRGDTVYAVTLNTETFTCGIHRGYIACIDIRSTGNYMIICHEGLDDEPYFDKIYGRFEDFGKNVFLTREEAESELERRNGNADC